MTLDSSVMNVSIATVAKDVGTTVTGIQTAITLYTLVMASVMITGGKLGQIIGRKRAFAFGCVVYGCGSLVTALSQSLAVLIRLVAARGSRRCSHHAGDRCPHRDQLRPQRPTGASPRPARSPSRPSATVWVERRRIGLFVYRRPAVVAAGPMRALDREKRQQPLAGRIGPFPRSEREQLPMRRAGRFWRTMFVVPGRSGQARRRRTGSMCQSSKRLSRIGTATRLGSDGQYARPVPANPPNADSRTHPGENAVPSGITRPDPGTAGALATSSCATAAAAVGAASAAAALRPPPAAPASARRSSSAHSRPRSRPPAA
jgi:hypothetical protein